MIIEYLDSCNASKDYPINELFFRSFYFLSKDFFKDCFGSVFKKEKKDSVDMEKLNNLYLLYNLNNIIDLSNSCIHSVAMNMSYVKPLRVMPERYYRYQNYSVNEISSDGKNLAMYFANLKKEELKKFHPSPEVDDVQDVVNNRELVDMVDFIVKTVSDAEE